MAYQALYRQWRPVRFQDMVGQEAVVGTLRRQVAAGRVNHAYLFCGSRGTGKTSVAKIMSRAVNCLNPKDGDPCGECENCRRLLNEESVDVQEIDAASNNGVDEVRELRESVKYPPQQGKYKVYIIDEVHMLSPQAFNALLKTLEEPPAYTLFILATTEPEKLPATILSRCQRYDFARIPAGKIAGRLKEAAEGAGASITDEALMQIAVAAEGGMRDALSMLDMCIGYSAEVDADLVRQILGTTDRSFLISFTDSMAERDTGAVLKAIDQLMRSGREAVSFSRDVTRHLRALLLAQSCSKELPELLDITEDTAALYRQQAGRVSANRLLRLLELFSSVESDMRWSVSPRTALETAAMKACLKPDAADVDAMAERIAELETRLQQLQQQIREGAVTAPVPAAARPAPARKAAAAPAAPRTPAALPGDAAWKQAIDTLKRASGRLFAYLMQGRFAGFSDGVYRWEASPNDELFVKNLNQPEARQQIIDALTAASGEPCSFEAGISAPKKQEVSAQTEDSLLAPLRNTMGAENVMIIDHLK